MRAVVLDLATDHQLARDLVAGGVFVPGCTLAFGDECTLTLRNGDSELSLAAKCVWVDGDRGVGLQLVDFGASMKDQIAAFAASSLDAPIAAVAEPIAQPVVGLVAEPFDECVAANPVDEPVAAVDEPVAAVGEPVAGETADTEEEDAAARKIPRNVHERLRGLTLAQQVRLAQTGELTERIVLERMYGKGVWEPLLRNPRITGPEVARIARMGSLPRPQVETIVSNGTWLQVPEVRRALLSNPRLGTDQILRVLRLLPKHELKLAATQTAYPFPVRDAAKRMIRDGT